MAIAPAVAGALDAKTIELIGIALDVSCTHMYAPGVRRHIQRALKAGATREEITAVLQLACMQGLHSMCLGAPDPARGTRSPRAARTRTMTCTLSRRCPERKVLSPDQALNTSSTIDHQLRNNGPCNATER